MQGIFEYLLGILFGLLAGAIKQFGVFLEKKIINKHRVKKEKFGRRIVKEPLWIIGLILELGVSAVFLLLTIGLIGNTLLPGLLSGGLIVLALLSTQILKEKLNKKEVVGILLMIGGIISLSFSGMSVEVEDFNFLDPSFLMRLIIFTVALTIVGLILFLLKNKVSNRTFKGVMLINIGGLGFSISNFWLAIMTNYFMKVFYFENIVDLTLFIACSVILVLSNMIGVMGNQTGLKYGQASNLMPLQQISVQTNPILYYLLVYLLPIPTLLSLPLLICGAIMIIISSFLLSKRQETIESIKREDK
ncbi:MAG: hypothetical protein GF329_11655 [Candidatus Lokiarchaeota archaeon]|nr:hypothetical protein [Candidatus Lokiarchaeota archaeon]